MPILPRIHTGRLLGLRYLMHGNGIRTRAVRLITGICTSLGLRMEFKTFFMSDAMMLHWETS